MIEQLVNTIKELPKTLERSASGFLERFGKDEMWHESKYEISIIQLDSEPVDRFNRDAKPESSGLSSLTEETKEVLAEEGYSDEIIENIASEEEAQIYRNADVKPAVVNDKDALVRTDIDLEQKDARGQTNLERMKQGLAPLDKDGKPYELHHIGQGKDSPLAELTHSEHHKNGNDTILHDKKQESEIDRKEFAKQRAEHWKARAEQLSNP